MRAPTLAVSVRLHRPCPAGPDYRPGAAAARHGGAAGHLLPPWLLGRAILNVARPIHFPTTCAARVNKVFFGSFIGFPLDPSDLWFRPVARLFLTFSPTFFHTRKALARLRAIPLPACRRRRGLIHSPGNPSSPQTRASPVRECSLLRPTPRSRPLRRLQTAFNTPSGDCGPLPIYRPAPMQTRQSRPLAPASPFRCRITLIRWIRASVDSG